MRNISEIIQKEVTYIIDDPVIVKVIPIIVKVLGKQCVCLLLSSVKHL